MRIKLSKREVLLISILAAAALIYGYLTWLIFPSYTRIAELKTELMTKRQVAVDKDEAQKKLDILDRYLAKSKQELLDMEKKIPYNVRLPELIVSMDNRISFLGMDLQSISVGEPDTANKEYDIIPINISLTGKYDSIVEFIKYIEGNERKFIIDSFGLAPVKRGEEIPFDIALRTFALKDPLNAEVPEPTDYYFFKHNNGKIYPFLENNKKIKEESSNVDKQFEELENRQNKIDELLNKIDDLNLNIEQVGDGKP